MKITASSGRPYEWNDPNPPTQEDLKRLDQYDSELGPAPKQEPRIEYSAGGESPMGTISRDTAAATARYGAPILGGLMAGPPGATMGGIAAASAVGAFSSGFGETLAQLLEGNALDKRKIAASTVFGATPLIANGKFLARSAANIPLAVASSEMAKFLEAGANFDQYQEDLSKANKYVRFGVPVGLSVMLSRLGSSGEKLVAAHNAKESISTTRFGGSALLSEVVPDLTALEKDRINHGSKRATELLSNQDANIGEVIASSFPDAKNIPQLANELASMTGRLSKLHLEWLNASDKARQADAAANAASRANARNAPALIAEAKSLALEATKQKVLRQEAVNMFDGGNSFDIGKIASGQRMNQLSEMAAAAKDATHAAIGELYSRVGIGANDAVVSLQGVLDTIAKQRKPGTALFGDIKRGEITSILQRAFAENGVEGTMSLEGYRALQGKIASGLVKEGNDPKVANKAAAEAYSVVKSAADDFILNKNPGSFIPWKTAQKAAAAEFAALNGGAVEMMRNGDIQGVYSLIKEQGYGPTMNQVEAWRSVIAGTFDKQNPESVKRASDAGSAFVKKFHELIRDSLIDSSTVRTLGVDSSLRALNPEKLAGELQALKSKGYPIAELGLGDTNKVLARAKIASANTPGGLTVEDFGEVLKSAQTLGIDKAFAKQEYFNAMRDALLVRGTRESGNAAARLRKAAKMAGATSEDSAMAYSRAEADPLVKFLDNTSMKLSKDPAQNANWVGKLMTVESGTLKQFIDTLRSSGRADQAEELGQAASALILRNFESTGTGRATKTNIKGISDFFFKGGSKEEEARKTFAVLVGDKQYQHIVDNFAAPIYDVVKNFAKFGREPSERLIVDGMRTKLVSEGKNVAYIGFDQVRSMVQEGRYHLATMLYLDPRFASEFKLVGYSLDKFASAHPVNAIALRLAMQQDEAGKSGGN